MIRVAQVFKSHKRTTPAGANQVEDGVNDMSVVNDLLAPFPVHAFNWTIPIAAGVVLAIFSIGFILFVRADQPVVIEINAF